jgi:hypothetical protein
VELCINQIPESNEILYKPIPESRGTRVWFKTEFHFIQGLVLDRIPLYSWYGLDITTLFRVWFKTEFHFIQGLVLDRIPLYSW